MCGIAGIYQFTKSSFDTYEHNIRKMLAVIRHRGPDETGIFLSDGIAMGSVRLSIVDLTTGQQPISDESDNYWIVYNGEVFNYPDLRNILESKGVKFKTTSDTEVVVQMYATYGSSCVKYFNGQFAFCIWDKKKKELFLARDRAGIRPLFYYSQDSIFAFCSEIKGIFTLDTVEKSINFESLRQLFTYWTTVSPQTPFNGIFELPPAHIMHVNSGGISIERYWQLEFPTEKKNLAINFNEKVEELEELLTDAVKIRLRADVPVGAYLSGGLDSSVTTALIHKINPEVLNTFSIGFKEKAFDETAFQFEVAKYFDTNHTAIECTSDDIAQYFEETIWHTEFPVLRTSPTPMFMLSKIVRDSNIKVVITGEGADEVLAGYNIFKETKIRSFWANEPESTCRPKLLASLYPYLPMMKKSNNAALRMFFGYKLTETDNPLYSHLLRWNNTSRINTYLANKHLPDAKSGSEHDKIMANLPADFMKWSELAKSQYLEATIFMSGYLLSSQGDRVAMGHSVEGRYPFLDYRVVEFGASLPDHFKLNGLNEKFILKKMSEGKIPESITQRSKQAYRAPIASSFINPNAPGNIVELLSESCIDAFGIFDSQKVNSLIAKIKNQIFMSEIDQMAIAGILSTQILYKMFILNKIDPDTSKLTNVMIVRN